MQLRYNQIGLNLKLVTRITTCRNNLSQNSLN